MFGKVYTNKKSRAIISSILKLYFRTNYVRKLVEKEVYIWEKRVERKYR